MQKKPEPREIKIDGGVKAAIELLQKSLASQYRQDALTNIEEDKGIYQGLTDRLVDPVIFEQMKDTAIMQIVRLVSEDNTSIPESSPTSQKEVDESILFAVNAIKKKYAIEGELSSSMRDVTEHACFMEGTSFLRILPESYKDYHKKASLARIGYKRVDAAKVFYDPRCISDVSDGDWVVFMERYGNDEARQIAKNIYGFTDELVIGDPINVFLPQQGTGDNGTGIPADTETTFYSFYNKVTRKHLVFAGGDAQLLKESKQYPCINKFGEAEIPVAQYDATAFKKGIHAMSYIGAAKDLARQRLRQFNAILPHFERVNSPILAAMGAVQPQELADNLADALEAQAHGLNGIVPMPDPQSRIVPIFPQDISAAFERIIVIFDNELSKRLGLNLSIQEKQVSGGVPTATQVIEQSKVHAKAIANLNKLNVKFFTRVYDITVAYGRKLLKGSSEEFKINIADVSVSLSGNDIVELIKDWRGGWSIDTSVELQLTRNEKIAIIGEVIGDLTGYTQLNIMSEEEIKPMRDLFWAKILLLKLDEYIQQKEFNEFFLAIVDKNQQLAGGGQETASATPSGTPETQRQAARLGASAIKQPGTALV